VTPWVRRLIVANVLMFFVQQTAPALAQLFVFVPSLILLRPWTVVTYMFLHGGLGHIFFNMLGLFFFGPRVEERLGSNRFITLYFVSGVTGALVSYFLAHQAPIIGASAGVFGVMLAFAHFWPRDLIYIWGVLPVEAWLLVAIMTVMSLYSGYSGSRSGVADFAHLGGFAGAFLYLRWVERSAGTKRFRSRTTPGVADRMLGNWRKVDARSVHEVNRDEVNRILDKIGKSGLGSLTPQERLFLSNFVPPDDRVPPPS
jgi:membrane associated rhomboid family serine protease